MKMIPAYIDKEASNAERKLFKLFSESVNLNGWYCLHSLGVSNHTHKREGEIDFLLVGPKGIFVVEAKGGRVSRENGVWKFTDRHGRTTTKNESPFDQARTALYSLRADLTRHLAVSLNHYLFGYGTAFPDITFEVDSPEWDQSCVFDARDMQEDIGTYIERLGAYWGGRQKTSRSLSNSDIEKVIHYLRGNFDVLRLMSLDVQESESKLVSLTEEQYSAFDAMEDNPRTIFTGPAGTGKTLLAVEKARRNNQLKIKTLLICYNRLLARHLEELVKKEDLLFITVDSLHHFFQLHINRKGYAEKIEAEQDSPSLFTDIYPEIFLKAWDNETPYESLIIDEGQDVITTNYVTALDAVLAGGFKNGHWSMFMDPETQKDMFTVFEHGVYKELQQHAPIYKLSTNCRNTRPIAIQAELVSGYPLGRIKKVDGLPVKYLWYANDTDQASQVSRLINDLLAQGMKPDEITVLSPKRYPTSIAGSGRLRLNAGHYQIGKGDHLHAKNRIACGTIQSYKGLESSVIILTDMDNLDIEEARTIRYVGFTRARNALWVSMPDRMKGTYQDLFRKIAENGLVH